MGRIIKIADVLDVIRDRSMLPRVKRYRRMPYKMDSALLVVEAIGQERNRRFRIDDENRFAYENFIRWIHGDPEMECLNPSTRERIPGDISKGIYIAGNTGTGKSWCLDIMSVYCIVDNPLVTFGKDTCALRWTNVRTDAVCDAFSATGDIRLYKTAPVIGFQDLGSEQDESVYMGNRIQVMRNIIEHRGDCTDRITLITSNIPFTHDRFSARYGERCASRLYEMCNYFEIKGKDRRINQ